MKTPENTPEIVPSKKKNSLPIVAVVVVIGLILAAYLFGRGSARNGTDTTVVQGAEETSGAEPSEGEEEAGEGDVQEIKFEGEAIQQAGIVMGAARLAALSKTIPFNGQIATNPNGSVRVSSIVSGRVTKLYVSQGDTVRQGQTLAVVESRDIGEAQSAYQQAVSRFDTAKSNYDVVLRQARAGVFSRAPVEAARRAVVDAAADVRTQETAVRAARVGYTNSIRLARAGSFANPALEAARAQVSSASESVKTAQAALDQAEASTQSAETELERRRQLASGGAYVSRPVEEGRRALVAAQSARAATQSEVATTRVNLARARSLAAEGLVAKRDLENAQQAFETASARLETTQADVEAAQSELERQQKLASTNVAGVAEVQAAQGELSRSQAETRSQRAQVQRARDGLRLAQVQLSRERRVFGDDIANRREVSGVRSTLETSQSALVKARQTLALANTAYAREQKIFKQNLNNVAQVQTARNGYIQAQSDLRAARSTLALFKSSPGRSASVPILAPISGVVQERPVSPGEVLPSDTVLMTLVNLDAVAVEAAIYEKDFRLVRQGATVTLTVDAFPGRSFIGRINYLSARLDPETRTLMARALIPSSGVLRPGMFARGKIDTGSDAVRVVVPTDAVQKMGEKNVVFLPSGETSFKARDVQTGASANGLTEIRSGLKPGEKIVAKGAFVVKSQAMKGELAEE